MSASLLAFDGAQLVAHAENGGEDDGGCFDGFHGRHAGFCHVAELFGVFAVRIDAGICSEGDLNTAFVGFVEGCLDLRADLERFGHHKRMVISGHLACSATNLPAEIVGAK